MADKLKNLELLRVFGSDAKEILDSRERAITLHHTTDIDAAGDEIEEATRRVIRRKLPVLYYTGHGHIVDASLTVSQQLDIVIADNSAAPILFRSENGTEYFPFESVYAFGEIKSTYYHSKNYVKQFVDVIRSVRQDLNRKPTPPTYLGNGVNLGTGLSTNEKRPFRNPLFTFMLFVNGGDFEPSQLNHLYKDTVISELPNIICILDKGIVVNAQVVKSENGEQSLGSINMVPEITVEALCGKGRWVFIPFGDDSTSAGSNLAVLWFVLLAHLKETTLMTPDMLLYLGRFLSYGPGQTIG